MLNEEFFCHIKLDENDIYYVSINKWDEIGSSNFNYRSLMHRKLPINHPGRLFKSKNFRMGAYSDLGACDKCFPKLGAYLSIGAYLNPRCLIGNLRHAVFPSIHQYPSAWIGTCILSFSSIPR